MNESVVERLGALPLGELHAEGVCFRCGRKGFLELTLKRTVNVSTLAIAHVCIEPVGCERRRYKAKL